MNENDPRLQLSEADKKLPASSQQIILDAKKAYAAAEDAGDTAGMDKASNTANL